MCVKCVCCLACRTTWTHNGAHAVTIVVISWNERTSALGMLASPRRSKQTGSGMDSPDCPPNPPDDTILDQLPVHQHLGAKRNMANGNLTQLIHSGFQFNKKCVQGDVLYKDGQELGGGTDKQPGSCTSGVNVHCPSCVHPSCIHHKCAHPAKLSSSCKNTHSTESQEKCMKTLKIIRRCPQQWANRKKKPNDFKKYGNKFSQTFKKSTSKNKNKNHCLIKYADYLDPWECKHDLMPIFDIQINTKSLPQRDCDPQLSAQHAHEHKHKHNQDPI